MGTLDHALDQWDTTAVPTKCSRCGAVVLGQLYIFPENLVKEWTACKYGVHIVASTRLYASDFACTTDDQVLL
jgi:hypothetical protein